MKRTLAMIVCVLTLVGLSSSVASSSTPDRTAQPTVAANDTAPSISKDPAQVGPDSSCTVPGIPLAIWCEYGISQFWDPDLRDWHYFAVRAADLVAYHSWCTGCPWIAIPGATAHSGISATLYQTGMLISFRYASTEIKWLCHWYSFGTGQWGSWYFCG
jgi:hypothetical protein